MNVCTAPMQVVVRATALHYGDGSQELLLSCGHTLWIPGTRDRVGEKRACDSCAMGAPIPSTLVDTSILVRRREAPHQRDADCTLDADAQCIVCGVSHTGEPCHVCGGRAFHDFFCTLAESFE